MINDHAKEITREYREAIKAAWSNKLKKHNYTIIEEDESANDSEYKLNSFNYMEKTIGAVAFWKIAGEDGVIIRKIQSYEVLEDGSQGEILTGMDIALVGNALPYFKKKVGGYLGPIHKTQKDQNIKINDTEHTVTFLPYEINDFTLEDVLK